MLLDATVLVVGAQSPSKSSKERWGGVVGDERWSAPSCALCVRTCLLLGAAGPPAEREGGCWALLRWRWRRTNPASLEQVGVTWLRRLEDG